MAQNVQGMLKQAFKKCRCFPKQKQINYIQTTYLQDSRHMVLKNPNKWYTYKNQQQFDESKST